MQTQDMTYSESARGVLITEARARQELRNHGIYSADDITEALKASLDRSGVVTAPATPRTAPKPSPASAHDTDELATRAALALIECRARAAEAETARQTAATARNEAVAALYDAGWSLRKIGDELDCSHELVRRMLKEHRDLSWGGFVDGYSATPSLSELAEEYRIARAAQEMRAEAAGAVPGTEEWAAFFGSEAVAQRDTTETPLVWGDWMRHRAAMTREDA